VYVTLCTNYTQKSDLEIIYFLEGYIFCWWSYSVSLEKTDWIR